MREAIELARTSVREGGGPFGAVIAKDGAIVGRGANRVVLDRDPTAHAEVIAIRDACSRLESFSLEGCEVFASCEPCPMCLAALHWARVERVWFAATRDDAAAAGFDDAKLHREFEMPTAARSLSLRPLLNHDSAIAFREWLAKPDRVRY